MFKKLLLMIITMLMTFSAYGASPARKKRANTPQIQESPVKTEYHFRNFPKLIRAVLMKDDLDEVKKLIKQYFNTIVYVMQIQEIKFYGAVFYWLLREIGNVIPHFTVTSGLIKITIVFTINQDEYFALEVFVYDSDKNMMLYDVGTDSDIEAPVSIDNLSLKYDYKLCYVQSPSNCYKKVTTLRVFQDIRNHRTIYVEKPNPKVSTTLYIYSGDYRQVNYSPIREVLSQFNQKPDSNELENHLISIYSQTPKQLVEAYLAKGHEKFWHSLLYNLFNIVRQGIAETEFYAANGRGDILIHSNYCYAVLELKHHGDAKKALQQIEDRNYLGGYNLTGKPAYMVGINVQTNKNGNIAIQVASKEHTDTISPVQIRYIPQQKTTDKTKKTKAKKALVF